MDMGVVAASEMVPVGQFFAFTYEVAGAGAVTCPGNDKPRVVA